MNLPVPDPTTPTETGTPAPLGAGAKLPLLVVGLLALVLLLWRVFGGPEVLEDLADLERIERTWAERSISTEETERIRADSDRASEWERLLESSVGTREWRFGHRTRAPTRPPTAPANLRGRLGETGDSIVLEWDAVPDVDEVIVLRSSRAGGSATRVAGLFGGADTWEDQIQALSGTYTYMLRSVRKGVPSKETSNTVAVPFTIPFELTCTALTRDPDRATIIISPKVGAPRPDRFVEKEFVVLRDQIVGAPDQWFDYDTGWVFRAIFLEPDLIKETIRAPEFTAEGTRKRDADGNPTFKDYELERIIQKVRIRLTRPGAAPWILDVPR